MAKDPAFNFYTNDFDQKTKFFSHEQVGMYLRLLMAQHQHGHLTEAQMMHICGRYDADVFGKFEQDPEGKFFNDRLDTEIEKRRAYSESRKKNRSKKDNTSSSHDTHMSPHMDYENEIENDLKNKKESKNVSRGTIDERLKTALDEIYIDQQRVKWSHINFDLELFGFIEKVRGSPEFYAQHDTAGLRLAFQSQLRHAKKKTDGPRSKNDRTEQNLNDIAIILNHAAGNSSGSG